jgi:inhibitor of cysteine peptidase
MNKKNIILNVLILSIFLSLVVFTSCNTNNVPLQNENDDDEFVNTIENVDSLEFLSKDANTNALNFESEKQFTYFMSSNSNNYYNGIRYSSGMKGGMMVESAVSLDMVDSSISASPSQGLDYSGTNVQVQNVDEGDIIKTDGNYIYTISNKVLYVIKAYPGEDSKIVSTYTFENYPLGLYINGNKLMVYENVDDYSTLEISLTKTIKPGQSLTSVKLFDITDKEDIKLISEKIFEGYYQNSRMIDDVVYLVTDVYDNYQPPIYYDGLVRNIDMKNIFYYPLPYSSPHLVSVQSLDINSGDLIEQKLLTTEYGNNLYMSDSAIYLTSTKQINQWDIQKEVFKVMVEQYLTADDKSLISKIQNTDSEVLSNYEKENKIYQVYSNAILRLTFEEREDVEDEIQKKVDDEMAEFEYFTYTIINKIDVKDGKLDVSDYAKVPGRVNNQFSMDEYNNVLRIATTIDQNWYSVKSTESENHIYTLDKNLEIMDSIKGIAKTETIYSSRFIENKLYLVTFRQVDPFFVFDLSKEK